MPDDLINELQELAERANRLLDDLDRLQDDDSDESNSDHLNGARRAVAEFEGHVGNLVP